VVEFHDRRPDAQAEPEDYGRPLTRTTLVEANRRFRQDGVQATVGKDPGIADRIVKHTIKERFNGRRKGFEDFPTVGAYLDYLNGQAQ
jgi:hypothetical protein